MSPSMKNTDLRQGCILQRFLLYLNHSKNADPRRLQQDGSPPPQVFRFHFFLIRKTHWSENVLTSQGNCKGLDEIKRFHTLCSFSRRSGLSGTPLRLCGIYQKQTFVCSGCSGFHEQANIQVKQKSMRIWEKTVSKILCTPGGSLSD